MRSRLALLLTLALAAPVLRARATAAPDPSTAVGDTDAAAHAAALALIRSEDVERYVRHLASPELEGRDSPSRGLALAARFIADRMAELELEFTDDSLKAWREAKRAYRPFVVVEKGSRTESSKGTYLRPWTKPFVAPVPKKCALSATGVDADFEFGVDFVPVAGSDGKASGELVFCGYGIQDEKEGWDDLDGLQLSGRIALVLEGEPDAGSKFEGAQVSKAASLWSKVETLEDEGVDGILVVRPGARTEDAEPLGPAYRFTQAEFLGEPRGGDLPPRKMPPVLVVSEACASALLGSDVAELRAGIDRAGAPQRPEVGAPKVSIRVATELVDAALDNVVGIVPGSDAALDDEYVVVGAHYDHIGAGPRGRVGLGADDNASGTSALLEITEALASNPPRRSVLIAFFSGEEDGLLGSNAFCRDLPIDKRRIVAMVNLDMIGRGPKEKVVLLGVKQNPDLEEVVERARALSDTGVTEVEVCRDDSLFARSDHYSFHQLLGVPTLFFLENYPVENNPDYHTWRDTVERLNVPKVHNTARLAFNAVWLLANDDDRPPRPR